MGNAGAFSNRIRLITPRQSPPHDHFIKVSGLQGVNLATFITLKGNLNPTKQPFYTVVNKEITHYLEFIVQKSKTNKRGTGGKRRSKRGRCCGLFASPPRHDCFIFGDECLGRGLSCSPDFGVESVVQRFEQLQPKVCVMKAIHTKESVPPRIRLNT